MHSHRGLLSIFIVFFLCGGLLVQTGLGGSVSGLAAGLEAVLVSSERDGAGSSGSLLLGFDLFLLFFISGEG